MRIALALLLFLARGPALAQASGWYMGGGPGATKADFVRGDFTGLAAGAHSVDDSDIGARVFGGFRVAPYWSIEFGVAALGRYRHRFVSGSDFAVYHYDASAATVAMAANLPVAGRVSMNGRLGAAFTSARLRLKAETTGFATPRACEALFFDDCTSERAGPYWGAGLQVDISPRWGVRLDYDDYGEVGEEFESGRADIEQWSVNILHRF